jgi:hypothetical protein
MKRGILFFITLSLLVLSSCDKDPSPKEMVIGEWAFSVFPDKNIHNNGGVNEDRTIFCGGERLTFNEDQTFELNGVPNGTWSYADNEISVSFSESYSCGDYPAGALKFKIQEISETNMHVRHTYYVFDNNYYKLIKQ